MFNVQVSILTVTVLSTRFVDLTRFLLVLVTKSLLRRILMLKNQNHSSTLTRQTWSNIARPTIQ